MQVSQVNEYVTHAVIGGKQAIDFGISNSAEFFNILSSTLYKDQILAVVREVLCNAWDAHIEAGCTDRPVQITLDHEKFTIKDFGTGIHHDDMGMIYGTYGNSTKKNDGKQTGGFGLGCKAPFAYTDHFEVISCNAGIKTIYNLSKSSAQAQGKPGIIPIASFPTDESGLTVSIRIKGSDFTRFHELIHRIVRNGDMNMTFNAQQIETIGFDTGKGNYLIVQGAKILDNTTTVMVRYGNVIYPIDSTKEIEDKHGRIVNHLKLLTNYNNYQIIFQAPPHSISVTPSRESLSMQEHTVNTLNTLFAGFLDTVKNEFPSVCDKYAEEITQKAVTEKRIDELLIREERLPALHGNVNIPTISDLEVMASAYMRATYPKGLKYRKADITRRLKLMVQEKLLDQGKVQTFLLALKEVKKEYNSSHWTREQEKTQWLQRRVIAPLLSKLGKAGLDNTKLYLCDSLDVNYSGQGSNREKSPPLVPAAQAKPKHLLATLPYLRNIVVVTSRRDGLVDRVYEHEAFKGLGKYQGFLVYTVGKKKVEAEAARQFFADVGMRIVDLTVVSEWERTAPKSRAVARTPAKKGLACLSSILLDTVIDTHASRNDTVARVTAPEFVIKISVKQDTSKYHLENWDRKASAYVVQLFGDKGGVTTTSVMHDNWIAKGAKDFDDYITEKVCNYIYLNPRIQEYWGFNPVRVVKKARYHENLINLIYSNPILIKEFSLVNNLTDEDNKYLHLWEQMRSQYRYSTKHDLAQAIDWLDAIPLAPESQAVLTRLKENPLLELLDVPALKYILSQDASSPQVEKALEILITVLNQ